MTFKGNLKGYIQTPQEKGEINIRINSPGLPEKTITY